MSRHYWRRMAELRNKLCKTMPHEEAFDKLEELGLPPLEWHDITVTARVYIRGRNNALRALYQAFMFGWKRDPQTNTIGPRCLIYIDHSNVPA